MGLYPSPEAGIPSQARGGAPGIVRCVASPAIEVSDLRKSYGAVEAVRGVSFRVQQGEVFGLLGPNGAGKTTTVEILEGYRERSGGDVRVLGPDPAARDRGRSSSAWASCCRARASTPA